MSERTTAHFVDGPLDGTKINLDGEPPPDWRTPGALLPTMAQADLIGAPGTIPLHRYRLLGRTPRGKFVYGYDGQESA